MRVVDEARPVSLEKCANVGHARSATYPTRRMAPRSEWASPLVWLSFPLSPSSGTTANGLVATSSTLAGSGWAVCARSTSIARPGAPSGCSWTSTATRRASSRSRTRRSSPPASASPTRRRRSAARPASAPSRGSTSPRSAGSTTTTGSATPRPTRAAACPRTRLGADADGVGQPDEPKPTRGDAGGRAGRRPWKTYQGRAVTPSDESSWSAAAEERSRRTSPRRRPSRPRPRSSRPPTSRSRPRPRRTSRRRRRRAGRAGARARARARAARRARARSRRRRRGEILSATPEAEDLKAQPGPDAVRPTRAAAHPPGSPAASGAGAGRPARGDRGAQDGHRVGVAVAAVLFFVIRRLR